MGVPLYSELDYIVFHKPNDTYIQRWISGFKLNGVFVENCSPMDNGKTPSVPLVQLYQFDISTSTSVRVRFVSSIGFFLGYILWVFFMYFSLISR